MWQNRQKSNTTKTLQYKSQIYKNKISKEKKNNKSAVKEGNFLTVRAKVYEKTDDKFQQKHIFQMYYHEVANRTVFPTSSPHSKISTGVYKLTKPFFKRLLNFTLSSEQIKQNELRRKKRLTGKNSNGKYLQLPYCTDLAVFHKQVTYKLWSNWENSFKKEPPKHFTQTALMTDKNNIMAKCQRLKSS